MAIVDAVMWSLVVLMGLLATGHLHETEDEAHPGTTWTVCTPQEPVSSHDNITTEDDSCISLYEAWLSANNGDTLQFTEHTELSNDCSCFELPRKSLSVQGSSLNDTFVGCAYSAIGNQSNLTIVTSSKYELAHQLIFMDIHFRNINVFIFHTSVTFERVSFINSSVTLISEGALRQAEFLDVSTKGRAFCRGGTEACRASTEINVQGTFAYVMVSRCLFLQTRFTLAMTTDTLINVFYSTFGNDIVNDNAVVGGMLVEFWPISTNSTLVIWGSRFTNQFNWSPVDAVMNIFEAALRVNIFREMGRPEELATLDPSLRYNISIDIRTSVFVNNERALTIHGNIEFVHVQDTIFADNIAMHAGAGILLLSSEITILRCRFENNSAGNIRQSNVLPKDDLFYLSGDVARVDSKCCKGSVTLVGKGGAIRVQQGRAIIQNSTFTNNTARVSGGTIFVDRGSLLDIFTSQFSNSDLRDLASHQGEIIYSNGHVKIDGGMFNVQSASSPISLFQHSGDRWSIEVYDINVQCPVGYNIRVTNTTSYRVESFKGLKRSYKLDQLSHFCESCPRYKYSLDNGHLTYNLDQGVLDYFALMINEEYPEDSKHERYNQHSIVCKSCPYGGVCDTGLKALPNFWGYEDRGNIMFQACPSGYCCSQAHLCLSHNTCAPYRTGRLCGLCIEGYTEALFSPKCVPNETCGPVWIWPFAFSTGVIYMLLLLFQKDIRLFMFSGDVNTLLYRIYHCHSKTGAAEADESSRVLEPTCADCDVTQHILMKDIQRKQLARDIENSNDVFANGTIEPQEIDAIGDNQDEKEVPQPTTDIGAIFLIMVMYYFQDAMLFQVHTITNRPDGRIWTQIKKVLLGLFKFRLEIAHFVDNVCLVPSLPASQKLLAKTLIVPFILLLFILLYVGYSCFQNISNCCWKDKKENKLSEEKFQNKLATGFMLTLLFMYQLVATTSFKLLNCVRVGVDGTGQMHEISALYIEGTVTCHQPWQYGVIAYAACCVIPFCFVLMLGPGMIKERKVSTLTFFLACICPLPFVMYWAACRLYKRRSQHTHREDTSTELQLTASQTTIYTMIHGPFRDINNAYIGPVCWAGVLIFRRLVLILFFTFVNNSLIRIISMLCFCFAMLLVHVYVKPYREERVNVAGSVSISALMVVGGINLIRASFEVAEYLPQGPNALLITVIREAENVLMLWVPLVTMSIILLILVTKICIACFRACTYIYVISNATKI